MIISPSAISPYKIPTFQSGGGSGFDPDAQGFITAAGITGETQQAALNQLVLDLKSGSVWDLLDFLYPMCPTDDSTASRTGYQWNIKDPRDLDAAHRITWVNDPTATTSGITGNGSSMYGNTNYNANSEGSLNDHMIGFTGNVSGNNMGATAGANNPYNSTNAGRYWGVNSLFEDAGSSIYTNGFLLQQRTTSSTMALYNNSSTPIDTSVNISSSLPNINYFILSRNLNGTPSGYSNTTYTSFFGGRSLSEAQIASFITALNSYNTSLGR
jgi:hypothetical protein